MADQLTDAPPLAPDASMIAEHARILSDMRERGYAIIRSAISPPAEYIPASALAPEPALDVPNFLTREGRE